MKDFERFLPWIVCGLAVLFLVAGMVPSCLKMVVSSPFFPRSPTRRSSSAF